MLTLLTYKQYTQLNALDIDTSDLILKLQETKHEHKPIDELTWGQVIAIRNLSRRDLTDLVILKEIGLILFEEYEPRLLTELYSASIFYFAEILKLDEKEYNELNTEYDSIEKQAGADRMEQFKELNAIKHIIKLNNISPKYISDTKVISAKHIALQLPYREVFSDLKMSKIENELNAEIHKLQMSNNKL